MDSKNTSPKITIGLPVFNGEKTIKKTLDSVRGQTFTDFQIIISDNNSIDKTEKICQEYCKNNPSARYIRQNKNIGALENFKIVLDITNSEYFVWLAADDWWEPTFLEKNMEALDTDKKYVGSVSKINYYDIDTDESSRIAKSIVKTFHSYDNYEEFKKYDERVYFYLRLNRAENIYGLFKTSVLKQCSQKCLKNYSVAMDLKVLLFMQKFGRINLINEVLMHRSGRGMSSKYSDKKVTNEEPRKTFSFLSFAFWVLKELGPSIFLKNLDYLMFINGVATKKRLKKLKTSGIFQT